MALAWGELSALFEDTAGFNLSVHGYVMSFASNIPVVKSPFEASAQEQTSETPILPYSYLQVQETQGEKAIIKTCSFCLSEMQTKGERHRGHPQWYITLQLTKQPSAITKGRHCWMPEVMISRFNYPGQVKRNKTYRPAKKIHCFTKSFHLSDGSKLIATAGEDGVQAVPHRTTWL